MSESFYLQDDNVLQLPRKRCMDLVSFETQQEYDWVKGFIDDGVKFFWTSGRKFKSQDKKILNVNDKILLNFQGATSTAATNQSSSQN